MKAKLLKKLKNLDCKFKKGIQNIIDQKISAKDKINSINNIFLSIQKILIVYNRINLLNLMKNLIKKNHSLKNNKVVHHIKVQKASKSNLLCILILILFKK